jgi:tetratricopeptide (TPR) repeat protein
MEQYEEAKIAFEKIISHGRTAAIRKAAEGYWTAFNTAEGADEEAGKNLEQAVKSIPLDYRQPTLKYLEELNNNKKNNDDSASCYLTFAIGIVDRIVSMA